MQRGSAARAEIMAGTSVSILNLRARISHSTVLQVHYDSTTKEPLINSLKRHLPHCSRTRNTHLRRVNSVFYSVLRTSPFGPAGAVLSASLRVARLRLASARLIKLIRGSLSTTPIDASVDSRSRRRNPRCRVLSRFTVLSLFDGTSTSRTHHTGNSMKRMNHD